MTKRVLDQQATIAAIWHKNGIMVYLTPEHTRRVQDCLLREFCRDYGVEPVYTTTEL